ncbi:hypothetical protein [Synechococcus phage BUCT-ZZ01]|nr:hypothetical protein [Synechococcus phage BUCT-ZZ01]
MKTAPEIIAEAFCTDWLDVKSGKYQRYTSPAVYVYGNDYYCCPTQNQKLPKDFDWKPIYTDSKTGRVVYEHKI